MRTYLIYFVLIIAVIGSCTADKKGKIAIEKKPINKLIGKWVRIGHTGPISLSFKENGTVEGDFGNDQTIDIITNYQLSGDTIKFIDKAGNMCQGVGQYKLFQTDYYVSFDLIEDDCGGRIKSTMGFWTKPNFKDLIQKLDNQINESPSPDLHLTRGRIFLAISKVNKAKEDFDTYISTDSLNAKVFLNRAGTKFPFDLEGVISDCNKAIAIDNQSKNAYFLRGLARYELGEKEQGCEDFTKAIELGFSILRIAEKEKCIGYWPKE
jgi:tetratricopeptide (TPR) repeat protein